MLNLPPRSTLPTPLRPALPEAHAIVRISWDEVRGWEDETWLFSVTFHGEERLAVAIGLHCQQFKTLYSAARFYDVDSLTNTSIRARIIRMATLDPLVRKLDGIGYVLVHRTHEQKYQH